MEEKKKPTVVFKGTGKFIIVPSSKYPDLQSFLADSVASDTEVNAVVDNFTVWAISDLGIEAVKVFIKVIAFFERIGGRLNLSVRLEDGFLVIRKKK